ncbi:MAG: TrkH family potassium uptake protein [Erysipelotrichaceae bacterium]|nr:TrkH family potassium uptake protein [Erysipelotrichaceae bacterium]
MNKSFIRYVVGHVISFEGVFLVLTSIVGILYKESEFLPYLICGILYLIFGLYNRKNKPESNVFYATEGFVIVALSWIFLSLLGAIPFVVTGEIPNFLDALFEVVSGFTTTGSTIMNDPESLSHVSAFWRVFTHWIGGMGILVFVLAILPMAGGYAIHILKAESPGPSVGKLVSKLSTTAKILYAIYFGITCLEVISLLICKLPLFDSICISFATAGTGGLGLLNDGFLSYSNSVQIVTAIFMMLFGINFNIYYFILIGKGKEALKSEELKCYLGIIIVATLLIAINTVGYYTSAFETLKHSFFQVSSIITTTGFASTNFDLWPTFSKVIIIALMFIGAMAGSTGGGIKVSRIMILLKDIKQNILHYVSPRRVYLVRFENKRVDDESLNSIKSYLVVYVAVFVASLLIISLDKFNFTESFTAVVATLNNIGPGLERIGPLGNFAEFSPLSKIVLIFDMITGRLEILPMLVLFLPLIKTVSKKLDR